MNTMNSFFSQLKKETQKIRLAAPERERMRLALDAAMASSAPIKSPIQPVPSPYFFAPRSLVPALALILVAGVGTSYAAEGAVPGDALYAIKVGITEPAREALARSDEAKAALHARFAERRMAEAETLAERGALTAKTALALEENFSRHAAEVEEIVSAVEEENPVAAADISARFGSSLAAHGALIEALGGEGGEENRRESGKLARSIKERERAVARAERVAVTITAERGGSGEIAVQTFAKDGAALSASIVVRDADEAVLARIEANASTTLERAETRFSGIRGSLDKETSALVEARIFRIRELIGNFRDTRGKGSEKEKIQQALKDAATLDAFLEAQAKFRGRVLLPAPEIEMFGDEGESEDGNDGRGGGDITIPVPASLPL